MSRNTEERMASLNALAEHVNQKIKALENQKHTVERAVVESNRLNEMIWAMDVQINKLNEGGLQATRTEELIERVETLSREDRRARLRRQRGRARVSAVISEARKGSNGARGIRAWVHRSVDGRIGRKALEAFDQRVKGSSRRQSDRRKRSWTSRPPAIGGSRRPISGCPYRQAARTDERRGAELQRKQTALESLQESLAKVDGLVEEDRFAVRKPEQGPAGNRDVPRRGRSEIFKSHASAACSLRDRLACDRATLESFWTASSRSARGFLNSRRSWTRFSRSSPRRSGSRQSGDPGRACRRSRRPDGATSPHRSNWSKRLLAAWMRSARRRSKSIASSMSRSCAAAKLEALRSQMDGVAIQVSDARQKLEDVSAVQQQLLPLTTQLVGADANQIETAQADSGRRRRMRPRSPIRNVGFRRWTIAPGWRRERSHSGSPRCKALSDELHRSVTRRE